MKKTKKWLAVAVFVALIFSGIYWLLFGLVVPKTASLTLPRKWWNLPLRQPRSVVHDYLGEPNQRINQHDSSYEEWTSGEKTKKYFLRMDYKSDTVTVSYSIHYHYKNWLVTKDYLIDSFSTK